MLNKKFTKYVLISLFLLYLPTIIWSQESQTSNIMNRASQYYLGDKDEILINVNVWGYVQKPGQYLVPRNTDLISLISFAGGPREGAKLDEVRVIRNTSPSQSTNGHKGAKNGTPQILNVNVKRFVETGRSSLIPPLKPNDTVIIPQTFGSKLRSSFGYISTVALLAQTVFWIAVIARN